MPADIPPARTLERLAVTISQLVAAGKLPQIASDKEAFRLACSHLEAQGLRAPSQRSFERYVRRLRPLWRKASKMRAAA